MKESKKSNFWKSSRILILSFIFIILLGSILLALPQSVVGERLSIIDSVFTATSAACVTGLIVVDTSTKFTEFGQLIILILIQLGGLGIMTFSTFFIFLVIGKFSISDRDVIQETLIQSPIKNLAGLLKAIFLFTIIIEAIGAVALSIRFMQQMPLKDALIHGVFHSISAFCNAGFSLNQNSFINYQGDLIINFTLIVLIISGGLGFIVLHELRKFLLNRRRNKETSFSFHTKVVLRISAILIVCGFLIFLFFEQGNVLFQQSLKNKFLISLFQSVTCRTAGFNTVDISLLTNSTLFFMTFLMFIGASPGSCGGGVKTTTASVLVAMLAVRFKNRDDVNIANRRIPEDIVSRALSITFFSVFIIVTATILLMTFEQGGISHQESRGLFLESFFEVISAFGTVGLSTGLTAKLSAIGKGIIIATMFVGRIGPLTIALAIGKKEKTRFKYAQEKILIG